MRRFNDSHQPPHAPPKNQRIEFGEISIRQRSQRRDVVAGIDLSTVALAKEDDPGWRLNALRRLLPEDKLNS
jgi:hypothetical protein